MLQWLLSCVIYARATKATECVEVRVRVFHRAGGRPRRLEACAARRLRWPAARGSFGGSSTGGGSARSLEEALLLLGGFESFALVCSVVVLKC